jgi:hypothetical protein
MKEKSFVAAIEAHPFQVNAYGRVLSLGAP